MRPPMGDKVLKHPHFAKRHQVNDVVRRLQLALFREDDGTVDENKSVNGGDLVEEMVMVLTDHGLGPIDSVPGTTPQPRTRLTKSGKS